MSARSAMARTHAVIVSLSAREDATLEALVADAGINERLARGEWLAARLEALPDLTSELAVAGALLAEFEVHGIAVKARAARRVVGAGAVLDSYGEKTGVGRRAGDGVKRDVRQVVMCSERTAARLRRDALALGVPVAALARDRLLGLPLARVRQDWSVLHHEVFLSRLIELAEAAGAVSEERGERP